MSTATEQIQTLRQCIEAGGRGDFAKALLALYDRPSAGALARAYAIADEPNTAALQRAMRSQDPVPSAFCNEFPGLAHLDEPSDNPHAIRLRGEEAS